MIERLNAEDGKRTKMSNKNSIMKKKISKEIKRDQKKSKEIKRDQVKIKKIKKDQHFY